MRAISAGHGSGHRYMEPRFAGWVIAQSSGSGRGGGVVAGEAAATAAAWHAGYQDAAHRLFRDVPATDVAAFLTTMDHVLAHLRQETSQAAT